VRRPEADRSWYSHVSRETREADVAPAKVCRATVSKRSGTGRCGSQAAIEECVWQGARIHDASRAALYGRWRRMRLYAFALFSVVARSARN